MKFNKITFRYLFKVVSIYAFPIVFLLVIRAVSGHDDCPEGGNPLGSGRYALNEC